MARFVALVRGINVGGKNKVPMADLRAVFEALGYADVRTYIQSGNVLFAASGTSKDIEADIEAALEARFGYPLLVVVRSERQLRAVIDKRPPGFGDHPDLHHSDVLFLKAPLTGAQAIGLVKPRDGVDAAWKGTGVMYFQRLSEKRTQSRLSTIASTPEYKLMTIRSWATTTKLVAMLDEPA